MTTGKDAPNLISTMNIGAFNTGNALGAWAGGVVISADLGLRAVPLAAGSFALIGLIVTILFLLPLRKLQPLCPIESISK